MEDKIALRSHSGRSLERSKESLLPDEFTRKPYTSLVEHTLVRLPKDRGKRDLDESLQGERASLDLGLQNGSLKRRIEKMGDLFAVNRRRKFTGLDGSF